MDCSHSPQAKGRIERLFGTLQNTMCLPNTPGGNLGGGHFYLAETRTFLLCVDTNAVHESVSGCFFRVKHAEIYSTPVSKA